MYVYLSTSCGDRSCRLNEVRSTVTVDLTIIFFSLRVNSTFKPDQLFTDLGKVQNETHNTPKNSEKSSHCSIFP